MADVTTYEDVAVPADRVWDVIGDFANIRKWAVAIQDQKPGEDSGRRVRTLTMPDGSEVKEEMVVSSQYSYTYSVLDRPTDYRSTIAVIPLDASSSRIELIVHVDASGGETDEDLTAKYTRFARGNLKAMKKALGLV